MGMKHSLNMLCLGEHVYILNTRFLVGKFFQCQDSIIGIVTCYVLYLNPGGGKRFLFSIPIQTEPGAQPASFKVGIEVIYWGCRSCTMTLTTHFHNDGEIRKG
jgi:hypothetical protein